jgi:hypothetical protein
MISRQGHKFVEIFTRNGKCGNLNHYLLVPSTLSDREADSIYDEYLDLRPERLRYVDATMVIRHGSREAKRVLKQKHTLFLGFVEPSRQDFPKD